MTYAICTSTWHKRTESYWKFQGQAFAILLDPHELGVITPIRINLRLRQDVAVDCRQQMAKFAGCLYPDGYQLMGFCDLLVAMKRHVLVHIHEVLNPKSGRFCRPGEMASSEAILIRRSHVLEDGFAVFASHAELLRSRFSVTFIDAFGLLEAGADGGGLQREFLEEVILDDDLLCHHW